MLSTGPPTWAQATHRSSTREAATRSAAALSGRVVVSWQQAGVLAKELDPVYWSCEKRDDLRAVLAKRTGHALDHAPSFLPGRTHCLAGAAGCVRIPGVSAPLLPSSIGGTPSLQPLLKRMVSRCPRGSAPTSATSGSVLA